MAESMGQASEAPIPDEKSAHDEPAKPAGTISSGVIKGWRLHSVVFGY